jgi:hypothetical protein
LGKGLRLAHKDFLCHLLDALILLHALLSSLRDCSTSPWTSLVA